MTGTEENSVGPGESDGDGTDGDSGPNDFQLKSAALDPTRQSLALQFSEPVAPVDGVDARDFRISLAMGSAVCPGECEYFNVYWDPNYFAAYDDPEAQFQAESIAVAEQATDVILGFDMPLDPGACAPAYHLFVHYSPGGAPVRSSDGEALAPIGPEWADYMGPRLVTGPISDGEYFGDLDPQVDVFCER